MARRERSNHASKQSKESNASKESNKSKDLKTKDLGARKKSTFALAVGSVKRRKREKKPRISSTTRTLVLTMARFSVASIFFVIFSLTATMLYVPEARTFSAGMPARPSIVTL